MTTLICNCNQTMPIDGPALARALGLTPAAPTPSTRCSAGAKPASSSAPPRTAPTCSSPARRRAVSFSSWPGATEGALPVAERPIRFVNVRESGGWSKDAASGAAEDGGSDRRGAARATRAGGDGVVRVGRPRARHRQRRPGAACRRAARRPARRQPARSRAPAARSRRSGRCPVHTGRPTRIAGWLGAFEVTWTRSNPIDADLCTRCNACIDVCPEQAIDFSYQIDLAKCTGHRDCVRACGAAAAIDFERVAEEAERALRPRPRPAGHGLDRPAPAAARLFPRRRRRRSVRCGAAPARERRRVREAEVLRLQAEDLRPHAKRPDRLHARASTSARRRRSAATRETKGRTGTGGIVVDPHSVRRLRRVHDGLPERRAHLRRAATARARQAHPHDARDLRTRRRPRRGAPHPQPGGRRRRDRDARPCRAHRRGAARIAGASAAARGLAHGVGRHRPVAVRDRLRRGPGLGAGDARGSARVPRGDRCPDEGRAGDPRRPRLRRRALSHRRRGRGVAAAGGRSARPVRPTSPAPLRSAPTEPALLRLDAALRRPAAATVRRAATFAVQPDKRTTLDLAFEHLLREAPTPADVIALPPPGAAPSPFGAVVVDKSHLHPVPGVRRRLPGRRARRPSRFAAPQLHREELRPVRSLREHLPGRRDHARAAAAPRRRRQGAAADAGAQRSRAVSLHPLRQAVRHAACDRGDGRQAFRPLDVPGPRRAAICRCAATAASSISTAIPAKSGSPSCERRPARSGRSRSPPATTPRSWRVPRSTACSPRSSTRRPMPRCTRSSRSR